MNHAPKTHLTPAERDAAAFEASRLRALSLRREAIDAFWAGIARAVCHPEGLDPGSSPG